LGKSCPLPAKNPKSVSPGSERLTPVGVEKLF
jgi:hypothetical protein